MRLSKSISCFEPGPIDPDKPSPTPADLAGRRNGKLCNLPKYTKPCNTFSAFGQKKIQPLAGPLSVASRPVRPQVLRPSFVPPSPRLRRASQDRPDGGLCRTTATRLPWDGSLGESRFLLALAAATLRTLDAGPEIEATKRWPATSKADSPLGLFGRIEWRRPGSNRQPPGCKPGALPVELRPRRNCGLRIDDCGLKSGQATEPGVKGQLDWDLSDCIRQSEIRNPQSNWAWLDSNQRPRPYQGRALAN